MPQKTSASACAASRRCRISISGYASSKCSTTILRSYRMACPRSSGCGGPDKSPEMAKIANDGLAEIVAKHPKHFAGWSALLPMNAPAAAEEAARSLASGANAIQLATNANGVPLDAPQFLPVFEVIANSGKPILLHPARTRDMPDYPSETYSKYEICSVLGWPYETGVTLAPLVFSVIMDSD